MTSSVVQNVSPASTRINSVSVVIPCFNAGSTIAETITSALSQAGVDLDVIVVDDSSRDASMDVVRSFGSVRVIRGPHRGASAARNRGIAESHGEWIVFLDSDDILSTDTLKKRLGVASETGADVIGCDWWDLLELRRAETTDGRVRSFDMSALTADAEIACATHLWATTAALMYRRTLVEKIGGFREDLPIIQDARFLFDAAYNGARFAYSPHVGARYRIRADSLSRRDPAAFWRDVLLNGRQIESLWRARGALSPKQVDALFAIFNNAARGLFAAAHPEYFNAVECQRSLGRPLPRHSLLAPPLARALGLDGARRILRVIGR
jgi:glycosyltransferase involved in cell wall biosynthesis